MILAVSFFLLLFVVCMGSIVSLIWMTEHHLDTWDDIFTLPRRKRQYFDAIARGAVPCGCVYGRTSRRYQTKFFKWEPCKKCGGTGALVVMPERTVLR